MRTWFEIIDDIKTLVEELDEKYRAELFKDKILTIRPKGEWQASTEGTDYRVCSICNYTRHAGTKYNFCPNCGADMRGEE